jgi:hypothetical protein
VKRRPDAGHLLDRLIAVVGAQPLGDHRGEARFVAFEDVDEFQQRADPLHVDGVCSPLRLSASRIHSAWAYP